jgi:hypothetical protein
MNQPLSELLYDKMLPTLYQNMEKSPYPIIPYVYSRDYRNPQSGLIAFIDYPRYTTGYASLFNTIGFTTEAHMFKTYEDRVLATYHFFRSVSSYMTQNSEKIILTRKLTLASLLKKDEFTLQWELDTSSYVNQKFRGYEVKTGISELTGQKKYWFNRDSVWEKEIPNYINYKPVKKVIAPDFYIVPQAWDEVIQRLRINNVEYSQLLRDTSIYVEYYYITDYKTFDRPYNGHYKHFDTEVSLLSGNMKFLKGDIIIPLNQEAREYLLQVLEPEGEDSFFNWNFFDSILSRKEYFSPYIFEQKASEILLKDKKLQEDFYRKKENDPEFAGSHYAQLRFIYERSPYSEKTYKRYPVARLFVD